MNVVEIKIAEAKQMIVEYITLIDTMLVKTMEGSQAKNWDLVKEVIDVLEPRANQLKLEVAQECLGILALYHPEAGHLRGIIKMSGMGSDLERMGDLVTKIALSTYRWQEAFHISEYPKILEMAEENRKMLIDVSKSFVEENCLIAVAVIQHDDRVDDLCTRMLKQIIKEMNQAVDVEHLLQIMNITRNFERIADLSTHLAEDVIFIKEGLVPNKDKNS
ncbi:MAG: phosphate signaling complex PhoU family protein [Brevinema sp.]